MIAVIFEVFPADGKKSAYLEHAAQLRPLLEKIEGFISVERFQSLSEPNKLLSLSFFRDEDAVSQWRELSAHAEVQAKARVEIFDDYRLRVAEVARDYGKYSRDEAPGEDIAKPQN